MFKQVISKTPLAGDRCSDNIFKRISGGAFCQDISFVSTLRALVYPRLGETDELFLSFNNLYSSSSALNKYSNKTNLVYDMLSPYNIETSGVITVFSFCHTPDRGEDTSMDVIAGNFCEYFSRWKRLEKVTIFYKKAFDVLCYINPEIKSVAIFTKCLNIEEMHYLQCSIAAFLPWYFDPKEGVSDIEMELIKSLRSNNELDYISSIERIAEKYDMREEYIKQHLSGFEAKIYKESYNNVCHEIDSKIQDITCYNEAIRTLLVQKAELEIKVIGLKAKISLNEENSEIMEYFLHNKNLILESVSSDSIGFTVNSYLEYFDSDMAERLISNHDSYLYKPDDRSHENIVLNKDMEKLLRAVFIDRKLKIKMCAYYIARLNGYIDSERHHRYPNECRQCTPNPHIDNYACIGGYEATINTLLCDGDFIGAIEQTVASCKSLNVGEAPTMEEFAKRLYGISSCQDEINMVCIELPNGDVVNPMQAITWLKEQEGNNNE